MARVFVSGSSQYLNTGSAVVAGYPSTMACWFNPDQTNQYHNLVTVDDGGSCTNRQGIGLGGDGILYALLTASGSGGHAGTSSGYSASTWQHACGVFASSTDRRIFLDGGSKGTSTSDRTPSSLAATNVARQSNGSYLSGQLAEIAMWNVALSDAEVAVLALGISPLLMHPESLVAYWPLIRDEDQDRVGGYHLTDYNSPTVDVHPAKVRYPRLMTMLVMAAAAAGGVPRQMMHFARLRRS